MTKTAFISIFLKLYNILWRLILPFLKKNRRLKPGFKNRVSSRHHEKADIWIQAASAGEAYLAVSLIKTLTPKQPLKVLVTSITQQGLDILNSNLNDKNIHKNILLAIDWFPFDIPGVMKEAVQKINPKVMVLLETEIWPALLWHLKQNRTKIYIVNARLSAKSFSLFTKTRFFWRHLAPDIVLATSTQDANRYKQIFQDSNVQKMSNIKFESIGMDDQNAGTRKKIKQILPENLPVTLLASVRKPEEKQILLILNSILSVYPNQVVAIFPRHMHRIKAWENHLKKGKISYCLRSHIADPHQNPKVILWNTFGELQCAYDFAKVVFVGGSLVPLGGQNFIEPAIAGPLTITGPYYDDFAWAGDAIFKDHIVIKKNNWKAVAQFIITALGQDESATRSMRKKKALHYIGASRGGAIHACNEILKAFDGRT